VTYLRIAGPDSKQFGPKVWCTFVVKAPAPKAEVEPAEPLNNPYHEAPVPQAEPLPQPVVEAEEMSYQRAAMVHPLSQHLMMLYEFGFTDFVVNEHLLKAYKDANVVADMLMNGQVTDESIR